MTTLRALECLVTVADLGSISKAAIALRISQPALSYQILALERELGVKVIDRLPRGVRLTPAGRAAVHEARSALRHVALVVSTTRKVGQGEAGLLRIATVETLTNWLLADTIRKWRLQHPGVDIELTEFPGPEPMNEFLNAGNADLSVGPPPVQTARPVELLGHLEMVVIAGENHRFAAETHVRLAALAREPFIHYAPENGLSRWVDEVMTMYEVKLNPVLRTGSPRTAAALAAEGVGVAIVPVSALTRQCHATVRRLRPRLVLDVVTAIATPADTLSRRFVDDLRQQGLPQEGRAVQV
jgi:DNA-binding transcriptional LysR family regulator